MLEVYLFFYEKESKIIDRGGYGTIHCVDNWKNKGKVAMKRIQIDMAGQDLIDRELKNLRRLCHPRIVKFYDSEYTSDRYLHIYMEYLPRGSLWKMIRETNKKGLTEETVKHFTRQILEGLAYLHPKHVHRDLKPQNILITEAGDIKLCDFGLTKILKEETAGKTTEHFTKFPETTRRYMAPELIDPDENVKPKYKYGPPVDIWSFGWTLVAMLTGDHPMPNFDTDAQVIFFIGKRKEPKYELPDGCSPEIQDFIRQCLQVSPCDRPSAKKLLDHSFLCP